MKNRRGLSLVESKTMRKEDPSAEVPVVYFRPREFVPETGIYRVYHGQHRVSHEVTLVGGAEFPTCKSCGAQVHFELLRAAPLADTGSFNVRLYEIPHPEDKEEESSSQVA